jgi:hypothetical protein
MPDRPQTPSAAPSPAPQIQAPQTPAYAERRDPEKAHESGPAPASTKKDSLKSVMPAGEASDRNPPQTRPASSNGGTSAAEDTTRTAGYVVDLSVGNEPPPGPPVAKDPALLKGADQPAASPAPSPKQGTPKTSREPGRRA